MSAPACGYAEPASRRIYRGDNFISSSAQPYEVENVVIPFFRWENEGQTDEHLRNQGHVASKGWNLGLSPDHLVLKPEPTSPLQHLPPTDRRTQSSGLLASCPNSPCVVSTSGRVLGTQDVIQSYKEWPTVIASRQLRKLRPRTRKGLYLPGQEAVVRFELPPTWLYTYCLIPLFSTREKGSPRQAWGLGCC